MGMDPNLMWFIVYYSFVTLFFLISPLYLPKPILYCSECEDISYWYKKKYEGGKKWKREPSPCYRCGAVAEWVDIPKYLYSKRILRWTIAALLLYPVSLILLLLYLPQFQILMILLFLFLFIAVFVLLIYQENKSRVDVKLWLREHY